MNNWIMSILFNLLLCNKQIYCAKAVSNLFLDVMKTRDVTDYVIFFNIYIYMLENRVPRT